MAPSVLLYHVVGDLTLGKPELAEFHDTETVEAAIRAIGGCSDGAVAVWRKPALQAHHRSHDQQQPPPPQPGEEPRVARFVGMLNSLDVVAFMAGAGDHERALRTPVSEVVTPNIALLKEVDPGTRLIDALEMMKQGVRCFLVRKSIAWKGMSKRFSVLYNGKWLKNHDPSAVMTTGSSSGCPPFSCHDNSKFCCLSREDVVRFLIGCLGALAPLPLSSISALGAISSHYAHIDASSLALEATRKIPQDPCVIAVVEANSDGTHKIIGEISAYRLQKCDYLAAAWAIANLSAGQFILGFEEDNATLGSFPNFAATSPPEGKGVGVALKTKKFSSRSIGFFSGQVSPLAVGGLRSIYRGRSTPLMCKNTSSLAAVMAQMLSHRAAHVWVTDADSDDVLVGLVSYTDIIHAVTRNPIATVSSSP